MQASPPIGGVHELHHFEFFLILILVVIVFYVPPKALASVRLFIEAHFGDSIGLYILHVGIVLVIIGGIWPDMSRVGELGNSLVIAAMGVLKLSKTPNGGGPTTTDTQTLTVAHTSPLPPADSAAAGMAAPVPPSPPAGNNPPPGWRSRT